MPSISPVSSEVIDPSTLDPHTKQCLVDELYATHEAVFAGVDKSEFTAYVVDSPAQRTRIQVLRAGGRVIGYQAIHVFEREIDGERWVVLRAEAGKLPDYRRCAKGSLMIAEVLRMCLRHPGARKGLLGCFVHPSAYLALGHVAPELHPHPQVPTPPAIRRTMNQLADAFGLERIDGAGEGVRDVGWITRETRSDQIALARRDDAWTRFYLAQNPGYGQGSGLVVLMPISFARFVRGCLNHVHRTLTRRFARPLPVLEREPVIGE